MSLRNLVILLYIGYVVLIVDYIFIHNMYIGLEFVLVYIIFLSIIFGMVVMGTFNFTSFLIGVGIVYSSIIFISVLIACIFGRYYMWEIFIIFLILITISMYICLYTRNVNEINVIAYVYHNNKLLFPLLFLGCVPLISAGLSYLYFYDRHIYLINIVYLLVFFICIFGLFNRSFRNYSIASGSIALLIPRYIFRNDIGETIMPSLLTKVGYWSISFPMLHNSLAFNSVVYPSISLISSSDVLAALKVVSIFVFCLIPMSVYCFISNCLDDTDVAYISALLFMFFFWYYATSSRRQLAAEFFLALFLVVLSVKELNSIGRRILLIIFGSSVGLSHYGVSYIFIYLLMFYWFTCFLIKIKTKLIRFNFVLYIFIFVFSWYIFSSYSLGYSVFLFQLKNIASNICKVGFVNTAKSEGLKVAFTNYSLDIQLLKFLNLMIFSLSIYGLYKFRKVKKQLALFSLPVVFLMWLVILPIGGGFDISRMFSIFLIFASPFFVGVMKRYLNSKFTIIIVLFLALYFFANCGVVSNLVHDYSPNMYSNYYQVIPSKNYYALYLLFRDYIRPEQDFQLKYWVARYVSRHCTILADEISARALLSYRYSVTLEFPKLKKLGWSNIDSGDYLYISYLDILTYRLYIVRQHLNIVSLGRYCFYLLKSIKIYTNNRSSLYLY